MKIFNIDFVYNNENVATHVWVRFESVSETIRLNGQVMITIEEYEINNSDLESLTLVINSKLAEKF